ncbi:MAG: alpha-amylase family glycosyl hydrolase [Anaerolineales bacterium]
MENTNYSPYADWFNLKKVPPDAYSHGEAHDYEAWWNFKSLPKFNTDNPLVRKYIMDVARYWIHLGADGWRLDVPNEIDDDDFWAEFRSVVKAENPDAYLVGEIWDGDPRWVGPKSFDGLMNYPVRDGILGLLTEKLTTDEFGETITRQLTQYQRENVYAMYNPLGSHDTARLTTELGGDLAKLKMATLIQMTYPGAPAIYYGDEIGLEGAKDPDCRRAFPWNENEWNQDLRDYIQRWTAIRRNRTVLRRGSFLEIHRDGKRGGYAYARKLGEESLLVVLNASATRRSYRLNVEELSWRDGRIVRDLLSSEESIVSGTELNLTLEPWSAVGMV